MAMGHQSCIYISKSIYVLYVSMYYRFPALILQVDHGNVYVYMFYGAADLNNHRGC